MDHEGRQDEVDEENEDRDDHGRACCKTIQHADEFYRVLHICGGALKGYYHQASALSSSGTKWWDREFVDPQLTQGQHPPLGAESKFIPQGLVDGALLHVIRVHIWGPRFGLRTLPHLQLKVHQPVHVLEGLHHRAKLTTPTDKSEYE